VTLLPFTHTLYTLITHKRKKRLFVRDRKIGFSQKEVWVLLRAPLFWMVVWSRHLFFYTKKIRKKYKYKLHIQNTSLPLIE